MKRLIMLTLMTFAFISSNAKAMDGIYEYENGNKLVRTKKDITFYIRPEKFRREFGTFPPNVRRGELIKLFTEKEVYSRQLNNCRLSTKMSKAQFDTEARKLGKFKFKPLVTPAPVKRTPVVKTRENGIGKFFNKLFNPRQTKRDAHTKAMIEKKMQQINAGKKPAPVAKNQPVGKKPSSVAKKNPAVNKTSPLQEKRDVRAAKRMLNKRGQSTPVVEKPASVVKKQPAPVVEKPTPVVKKQTTPVNKRAIRIAKRKRTPVVEKPAPVVKKQPAPVNKRAIRIAQRKRNRR
jgi:hypothetical protein